MWYGICQIVKIKWRSLLWYCFCTNAMTFARIDLLFDSLPGIYEKYKKNLARKCVILHIKKHNGQIPQHFKDSWPCKQFPSPLLLLSSLSAQKINEKSWQGKEMPFRYNQNMSQSGLRVALKSIQFRSFIVFFIVGLFRIAEVVTCVMVHFALVTIKGSVFKTLFFLNKSFERPVIN